MKTRGLAKKGLYIGASIGVVAFAVTGILYGSFIGGVLGLNIAGSIFGSPLASALMPRLVVGASMVLGVMFTGVVFVTGISLLGWAGGSAAESVLYGKAPEAVKGK